MNPGLVALLTVGQNTLILLKLGPSRSCPWQVTNVPNGSYSLTATKVGSTLVRSNWKNLFTVDGAAVTGLDFVEQRYSIKGSITGMPNGITITVSDGTLRTVLSGGQCPSYN